MLIGTTACSSANYDERMTYLRKTANRGAETHALLVSQEAAIDKERCKSAFNGLQDHIPTDAAGASASADWSGQVEQFFVDSCVSGKPKPVPGDPIATPTSTPTNSPSGPVN